MARERHASVPEGRRGIDAQPPQMEHQHSREITHSKQTSSDLDREPKSGGIERDLWRTRNHSIIRFWAESRGGHPALVENADGPSCVIHFPEIASANIDSSREARPISWGTFFEWFDERRLIMEYELKDPTGKRSWFNQLVRRTPLDEI